MARVVRIKAEPLTEGAFRPFGQIIGAQDRPPDYHGGGQSRGWLADFRTDGRATISASLVPFQGLTFTKLERHFNLTQAFIPLDGAPAMVAVAAPTDPNDRDAIPAPEQVRAFLLDGTKGYLLSRGTWHSLDRFPIYPPSSVFVIINDHETLDDLRLAYAGKGGWKLSQEVDYAARFDVTFELTL
jgi:ureidoglycolate lyase